MVIWLIRIRHHVGQGLKAAHNGGRPSTVVGREVGVGGVVGARVEHGIHLLIRVE